MTALYTDYIFNLHANCVVFMYIGGQSFFSLLSHTKCILRCSIAVGLIGLTACSTLPPKSPAPIQYAQDIPTEHTTLARLLAPAKQKHPDETGYHVLYQPIEALAARLHLIDAAEKTLDLQYYIWDNDKVGALALHAIINAANRGVKVRLLLDDNNSKNLEASLFALAQHQNIEVRLFNPHRFRKARALDFVFDLPRMNRRMHNKTFMADNQVALIGGRNMSNQYYNASDNFQFSDVDVLLVGSAVDNIIHSFDEYWNHDYAYPIQQLVKPEHHRLRFDSLKKQLDDHYATTTVQNYLNIGALSHQFKEWLRNDVQLQWVTAQVVYDSAEKIRANADKEQHLNFQLLNGLHTPKQNIELISAYFVPEKQGAAKLSEYAQDGVRVRVLTNSFKANDVAFVHAFYAKYREDLLKNGVELYEFVPTLPYSVSRKDLEKQFSGTKIRIKGLSRSSLHTKLMALDESQVFIGSFNFDPRSAYLNTEIGIILNSEDLAKLVSQQMDENLKTFAYRLELNEQGKIIWLKHSADGIQVLLKEPHIRWWQHAGLKFISWLPIEGFM